MMECSIKQRIKSELVFISILLCSTFALAQSPSDSSTSKSYPPIADKNSQGEDRVKSGDLIDAEVEAKYKKAFESMGYQYRPSEKGRKDFVEDTFSLPENEKLLSCIYTNSYSYPSICLDDNSNVIFDSSKDTQEVLDKIIKSQGKQGNYNKIPGGGPDIVEGVELD